MGSVKWGAFMDSDEKLVGGGALLNPLFNKLLPLSMLAALIGLLLGPVPSVLYTYFTGTVFYPLFVIAPLLAYLFNSLLKGGRDIRALIVISVFSLVSTYITLIACRATLLILMQDMSILRVPQLVVSAFGRRGMIPSSASAHVYPLVFTALGVCVAWELLRNSKQDSQDNN
jgi:hypothetical protein